MRKWAHVFVSVSVAGVLSLTTAFVSPVSASTPTWTQAGGDIDGEAAGDSSGYSVSLSADGLRMAIGANGNDGTNSNDTGHVRVYEWRTNAWVQLGADIDGEAAGDSSGYSVSLSADGSRVAIGAPRNRDVSGHVRVYEWRTNAWVQLGADLDGEVAGDWSGYSVSLSADGLRVAIGAIYNDVIGRGNAGHVRVYEWRTNVWVQLGADLDGEAGNDNSGHSVSLSADGLRVAIGAPGNSNNGITFLSGHVRVYEWRTNAWVQLGADINGEAVEDLSGFSVSLSADGSRVAIGATGNDATGNASGHVRVYRWSGTAWVKLGDDIDGEAAQDWSGSSVSLSADGLRVAIGAPLNDGNSLTNSGHVRVYSWNGTAWVQLGVDIDGEAADDRSGWSVSLSADGSRVAIGALNNDGNSNNSPNSGHVRVYQLNPWTQAGGAINGEAADDQSGDSVSLSADGSRVAIGATGNDGNGEDSGHVRVYESRNHEWVQLGGDINGEAAGDESGVSVSLSADGSRVAIGARYNDGNGSTDAGHVRVYSWNGAAWVQLGADIDGEAADDWSGGSVSLSADGSRVAIGANRNDGISSNNAGHVRVYSWNGAAWVQLGADINGEAADDRSGDSVSLSADGSRIAIGAVLNDSTVNVTISGHVRVYSWNGAGWVQLGSDIDGEAAGDQSGGSVSLSADGARVAIGALRNDGAGSTDTGHVRVYEWRTNAWVQLGSDIDGESADDQSGRSVSLSVDGARIAIGAMFNDGGGISSGHVRVYSWNGTAWSLVTTDIDGETADDWSGDSVSLSGNGLGVAIGAPFNDNNSRANSGHVRVFGTVQTVIVSAPTLANPQQAPTVAAIVTAPSSVSYRTGNAQVTLEWSAVVGAASYAVTQANGAQVCATTTTSCVVKRLRNGRAYDYNVFAVHANGARSTTSIQVSARPGFQVRSTTVNARRAVSLSLIVTTPSKGRKTWTVTSGRCRISGTRLVAPARAGSCKLRLSTTRSGAYGAMSTTINITVR
jgi:hypothetical protein